MKKIYLLIGLAFLLFSSPLLAIDYASPNVSLREPYYRDVEKLIAFGLIDVSISGQKPYSRTEFARLTQEAQNNLERLKNEEEKEAATKLIQKLQKVFSLENKFYDLRFLHQAKIKTNFNNIDARQTNIPNGLGDLDAKINPLLAYQEGRHYTKGFNHALETEHWINISPYFNLYLEPRLQTQIAIEGSSEENQFYLNQLSARAVYKNIQLTAGRSSVHWGQGENAGLLLSANARALDMIHLSNESPLTLPSFLKYLGPSKYSFFYSDLGKETFFEHSYLAGFKLSFKPFSFFEFGLSNLVMSGGEGAPEGSFTDRLGNLFPFVQTFDGAQVQIDNKLGGMDFRLRIPQLRNTELYLEAIFDDTPGSFSAFVIDDGGFLGGVSIPRINKTGTLDYRAEIHRTGRRYYRHPQFASGMAQNTHILGNELGPDAYGIYNTFNWDISSEHLLTVGLNYENRSNDFYIGPRVIFNTFKKSDDYPNEKRYQWINQWTYRPSEKPFTLVSKVGYERVHNYNFLAGDNRNHLLAELHFNLIFDQWFRKTADQ